MSYSHCDWRDDKTFKVCVQFPPEGRSKQKRKKTRLKVTQSFRKEISKCYSDDPLVPGQERKFEFEGEALDIDQTPASLGFSPWHGKVVIGFKIVETVES